MRFASRPPQRSHHRHQTPPPARTAATLITQFSKDLEQVRKEEILLSPVSLDRSPGPPPAPPPGKTRAAPPPPQQRLSLNGLSPWGPRAPGSALRLPPLSSSVVPVSPCLGQAAAGASAHAPRWRSGRLNGTALPGNGGGPAAEARREGAAARRRAPGGASVGKRRARANEELVGFTSMRESTVAFGALSSELKRKRTRVDDKEKRERKRRKLEREMEEREREREREKSKKRKRERAREREKEDRAAERDRRRERKNDLEVDERGKERKRERDKDSSKREKDRRRERERDRRKERDPPIKDSVRAKESERRAEKRERRARDRHDDSDAESSGESEKRTEVRERDKRRFSDRRTERSRFAAKEHHESEARMRDQKELLRREKERRDRKEKDRYREKEERRERPDNKSSEHRRKDVTYRDRAEERRDRKREERKRDSAEVSRTSPADSHKRKRGESTSPQEEPEKREDRVKLRSSPLSPSREERRSSQSDSSREKDPERPSIRSKGDKLLSSTRTAQPRISLRSGTSPNSSSPEKYRNERPRRVTPSKRKSAFAPVDESELEEEPRVKRSMYSSSHYGDAERSHIGRRGALPPSGRDRHYRSPADGSDGSPSKNGGNAFSGLRSKSVSPGHQRVTSTRVQLPRSTAMHPRDRPRREAATPPGEHAGTPALSPPQTVERSTDQKIVTPPSGKSTIPVPVASSVDGTDVKEARSAFLSQKAEFDGLMENKEYTKAENMVLEVFRKGFTWALAKETQFRKGRMNVIRDLPANVRNKQTGECIDVYHYIASGFAKIASNQFESLGRRTIAVTLRRHLSKAYGRMFLLQRFWDIEKRDNLRELSQRIKVATANPDAERTGWVKLHTRDLKTLSSTVSDYMSAMNYYDMAIKDGDDGGEAAGGECRIM